MLDLIFSGFEAFGTVIGAYLIVKQIVLTRESNEKNELIKKKETTLNAYHIISDDLRKYNQLLKAEFKLKGQDKLSEEDLLTLRKKPEELLKHPIFIYDYLSRLAIGVKNEIYDFDILVSISGRYLVRTFDRYEVYIKSVRSNYSQDLYQETEEFIENIRKRFIEEGETSLIK